MVLCCQFYSWQLLRCGLRFLRSMFRTKDSSYGLRLRTEPLLRSGCHRLSLERPLLVCHLETNIFRTALRSACFLFGISFLLSSRVGSRLGQYPAVLLLLAS